MNGYELFASIIGSLMWPIVILVIAIIFRKEIQGLIIRIQKFSVPSASIDLLAPDIQQQEKRKPEENFARAAKSQAIETVEVTVRDQIQAIPEPQRAALLINEVAKLRLISHFYYTYYYIFGSQIRALRFAEKMGGSCTIDEAAQFYHVAFSGYPDNAKDFTSDLWFKFIIENQLAIVREERFDLTPIGSDFLMFIAAMNLTENRAY